MSAVNSIGAPFNLKKLSQLWTLIIVFSPAMTGYRWEKAPDKTTNLLSHNNIAQTPVFDDHVTGEEIEATIGQTVLLPCTVRNLGDKVVSWIRSRDLHILTSDVHTFSSDNRFEPVHSSSGDFWGLRIRGVAINDTGQYECQVNTDPKMSLAFRLSVTVPGVQKLESSNSKWVSRALIKGPREVYVRDGSPVTFTCEISPLSMATLQSLASSAHGLFVSTHTPVRWLHNDVEIQNSRDDIVISLTDDTYQRTRSTLNISTASTRHSGRYTCMQPSAIPDNVRLFVIEEHMEAMQRDYPVPSTANQVNERKQLSMLIVSFVLLTNMFC